MLLQMAPLPSRPRPSGLGQRQAGVFDPIAGSISIDIGATALALLRYLSLVGVMLLATATTIRRDRAEAVLVALTAGRDRDLACTSLQTKVSARSARPTREEALSCACLGLILAAASACLVFERHETRRAKLGLRDAKFLYPDGGLARGAVLICAAAIGSARSGSLIFAACCGLGMFCAVFLVRRLNLGRWGAGAIGLTATVIIVALVTGAAGTRSGSAPRLRAKRSGDA